MTLTEMFSQTDTSVVDVDPDVAQFLAAEFAAMDAGKYHPTVRPTHYVAPDADPSMAQYDRAIASLSPESGKPTVH